MRKIIVIDLSSANTDLFEAYERKVLPLLSKYEGRLELSVRTVDGMTETHVLYFPDAARFDEFIADPDRSDLTEQWKRTGAISTIADVEQVDYLRCGIQKS